MATTTTTTPNKSDQDNHPWPRCAIIAARISDIALPCDPGVTPPIPIRRPSRHHSPGIQILEPCAPVRIKNPLDGLKAKKPRSIALISSTLAISCPFEQRSSSAVSSIRCMVVIEGDSIEQVVLRGPGAGEGPTASAVMGDVLDLARGLRIATFGQPAATLQEVPAAQTGLPAPFYLRMGLLDKPGALAKVATVLGDAGVSIDRMRQYGHSEPTAPVLIVTHKCTRAALDAALDGLAATDVVDGTPVALRIEEV